MAERTLKKLHITGMDCADCAQHIEEAVSELPGVEEAQVNFALATLQVRLIDDVVLEQVHRQVRALGYGVCEVAAESERPSSLISWLRRHPRDALAVLAGLLIVIGFLVGRLDAPRLASQGFYGLAILAGGYHIARAGWATLRATRNLDMNALMTIAAVGALIIGEGAEGAMAMFLFAVGNALEGYTMERARDAIRSLMRLAPDEATRLGGEGEGAYQERVQVSALQVGDRILVRPGERLPMDGVVLSGTSTVDQSPITGEATPVEVGPQNEVYAGSVNGNGALVVRVTRPAQDSTIARVIRLVEEAQAQRAPAQRFVDVFAARYTPIVIVLAAMVALVPPVFYAEPFIPWLYRALVLLVIACPCALVISTPVSIISALSNAARHGVLIKGGAYLEALGNLRVLAFDKTGTLTVGKPTVTDVIPLNGVSADEVLALAASIEAYSEHPLAQAIVHEARHRGLSLQSVADFTALTGQGAEARIGSRTYHIGGPGLFTAQRSEDGVWRDHLESLQAEGKTPVLVADEQGLIGIVALADRLRPEAMSAVAALHQAGIARIVLLTGDHARAAQTIAGQAGVDDVYANLLPEEKAKVIGDLLARYDAVGMVGDGVNDAPALARATIGIAMGVAGTAQALETADIALMADDLSRLPFIIWLSRQARRIIWQNIFFSIGIKAIFMALAFLGLATLWMAVFADMGASLMVTMNGMRLLRYRL
jgi:Cd2+/Zn2+-exporting ATPase